MRLAAEFVGAKGPSEIELFFDGLVPSQTKQLLDAGLVQDVYLTTGTKAGGEPGTPLSDQPLHGREVVRKNGTGADAGVLFQHIVIAT